MKVKLINKMEHRFIPELSDKQRNDLKAGKTVDVKQETADFLLKYKYVESVVIKETKVEYKKSTDNTNDEGL